MASYHLTTKPVSRGKGRSATAAAAYRAAEKVLDRTSGETFDYSRKRGVEHSEIVLSTEAARRDIQWARDRTALWNAAEAAERRKDARVAREYEIALPHEMSKGQRIELVRAFARELADRYGVAVDFSLHRPHREGDQRNFHAHVLTTTRVIETDRLGAKAPIEWSNTERYERGLAATAEEIKAVRARWADLTNERLREHRIQARVDHRTLIEQGIDREPTVHLGVAVWGMERRGIETRVGSRVREERELEARQRLERARELGRIERERQGLARSILDLSADLTAAKAARAKTPEPEKLTGWAAIQEQQRQGIEAWRAMREEREQREAERSKALEQAIAPVVSRMRPGRGLEIAEVPAWSEALKDKPLEWQGQVVKALETRLQADRVARIARVQERARQRSERRQARVRSMAREEPEAPKGLLAGLRRRAYEETHRAWRERLEPLERLNEQAGANAQRLYEAGSSFTQSARVREQLKEHMPELLARVRLHEREQQRLEREHSLQRSRGKELGRDWDLER
jgi:ATP-dependent exoDNAse (exonuclease V) alpha subunit